MSEGKIKSYSKSLKKHKGGIKSLQWFNYISAATRFKQLVGDVELEHKTILDVGCGFGDLIPFIASKTLNFKYTGVDLLRKFTDEAGKRYPEFTFLTQDYFAKPFGKFDVIFCSGALNGKSKDPVDDRKQKIKELFKHTKEVFVFNMAGGANVEKGNTSRVYYADSVEILSYCLTLTPKVIFKQHYHKKDFTIVMFK